MFDGGQRCAAQRIVERQMVSQARVDVKYSVRISVCVMRGAALRHAHAQFRSRLIGTSSPFF